MSEARLALVPHDLPDYTPNDPPPPPWRRVKVFYDPEYKRWNWVHQCPWQKTPRLGLGYYSPRIAYCFGVAHLENCL